MLQKIMSKFNISSSLSTDCVHLQLYKDLKERQKNGQTKASLSLQQYLGFESGFTLDKESNTLAILCEDVVPVLAFDTREILIQWRVKVRSIFLIRFLIVWYSTIQRVIVNAMVVGAILIRGIKLFSFARSGKKARRSVD